MGYGAKPHERKSEAMKKNVANFAEEKSGEFF